LRPIDRRDVAIAADVGPVSGEDALAVVVALDLPADVPASPFQPEVEPADPGEETTDRRASSRVN
jgi:hypothetical protein